MVSARAAESPDQRHGSLQYPLLLLHAAREGAFQPRREILTFEEIERFVRVVVALGVNRLRLTGGEPLVRAELPELVRLLSAIPGVEDIAMTTNGILLAEQVDALWRAGLRRLNISLDGVSEETFARITRRRGVDRVLAGIVAAQALVSRKFD